MFPPINNFELIEVKTSNINKVKFNFPDEERLRGKMIRRIVGIDISGNFKTILNNSFVNYNVVHKAYLVLVSKGKEEINRIHLSSIFAPTENNGNVLHINRVISWPDSYIIIPNTTDLSATESFVFGIIYDNPNEYSIVNSSAKLSSETIEIVVNDANKRLFYFPDDEKLNYKKLRRIFAVGIGYSPNNLQIDTDNQFSIYLTLNVRGSNKIYRLPFWALLYQANENILEFNCLEVNWPKSYIEVSYVNSLTVNKCFCFTLLFEDSSARPVVVRGR